MEPNRGGGYIPTRTTVNMRAILQMMSSMGMASIPLLMAADTVVSSLKVASVVKGN